MKVAVCFHGNCGILYKNKSRYEILGDIDYRIGYEHWKKHIFDINNVDVFIHSWDTKYEDGLIDLYKPKKFKIEPQLKFGAKWTDSVGEIRKEFMMSRWYSAQKSIAFKKQYELENNFVYDMVILSRTDWAWLTDIDFTIFEDRELFYSPHNDNFMKDNPRLDDWIFFSNSENMDKFSKLYQDMYVSTGAIGDKTYQTNAHSDSYKHAKNCGLDIVMIEDFKDFRNYSEGAGTFVRALYENCKYSEDYDFNKLKLLKNGRQSERFG
tara:strand:- start:547 stop:1344 length:798 start_codon:yes stop_codon:yes gene_type:complete